MLKDFFFIVSCLFFESVIFSFCSFQQHMNSAFLLKWEQKPPVWNKTSKCSVLKSIYIDFQSKWKHVFVQISFFFLLWGGLPNHSTCQTLEPLVAYHSKGFPSLVLNELLKSSHAGWRTQTCDNMTRSSENLPVWEFRAVCIADLFVHR